MKHACTIRSVLELEYAPGVRIKTARSLRGQASFILSARLYLADFGGQCRNFTCKRHSLTPKFGDISMAFNICACVGGCS